MFQSVDRYLKAWLNLQLLKYSHYPTYVRVEFRGTLSKSNFTQVGISVNSVQFKFILREGKMKIVLRKLAAIKRLREVPAQKGA